MILAPRVTPTGPPKFALHKEHKEDKAHKDGARAADHKDGAHAEEHKVDAGVEDHEEPAKEPTSA
jgi:hypothetical protein